jgi:beta-N-acetylhexosaminidase
MAIAAAGSAELAERVGQAIGRELAAVGVNVDWAPALDLCTTPESPAIGTRSFGDDPVTVGRMAAAFIAGLQSTGVAGAAKHYPGSGDTFMDPHHGLPVLTHDLARLGSVELPPFRAAIAAGVRLVMAAHVAVPAVERDGATDRPVMLSEALLQDLLRRDLGFDGVVVSDALDMGALQRGSLVQTVIASIEAGVDLLLAGPAHARRPAELAAMRSGLAEAAGRQGRDGAVARAASRVTKLRRTVGSSLQPGLDRVGSAEHGDLAAELARRSITLVRDRDGLLPLRHPSEGGVLVVTPRPADLTPADTSSYVRPDLAGAIRRRGFAAESIGIAMEPAEAEVAGVLARAADAALVVVGTINAFVHPRQAGLVRSLVEAGKPLAVAALRMPNDLEAFPEAGTYLCAWSINPASIDALAAVLCGEADAPGRLPVSLRLSS